MIGVGLSLGLGASRRSAPGEWNPQGAFGSALVAIFDPSTSDKFQDAAGMTPADQPAHPIGAIRGSDGIAAIQAASSARPSLARMPKAGLRNRLVRTEDLGNGSAWFGNLDKITSTSALAPDGSETATVLSASGQWDSLFQMDAIKTPGAVCCVSVWLRRISGNSVIHLRGSSNGMVYAKTVTIADGWQRYFVTYTHDGTNHVGICIQDRNASGHGQLAIWHPQVELGHVPSPYQRVGSRHDVTERGVPDLWYIRHDGDDALTASLPDLGAAGTIAYADGSGVSMAQGQPAQGATTLPRSERLGPVLYIDRALSGEEEARLTTWLHARRPFVVPARAPDVHVSARGRDSAYGTANDPVLTLARADAIRPPDGVLLLDRDGTWRETANGGHVAAYGSGSAPLIDGSDVVTGWDASGTANVWQAEVSHDAGGTSRLRVYEDGVLLTRVADLATCSAVPGSFVDVQGASGSPVTISVHPTGSAIFGKTLEVTVRNHALKVGNGAIVRGVHARRAIHNDGAIIAGSGALIERCLVSDGSKHNMLAGSGIVRDTIARNADPTTGYDPSNTSFVFYMNEPAGEAYLLERCGASQDRKHNVGITQYLCTAHGQSGSHLFDAGTFRQTWAVGRIVGNSPSGVSGPALTEGCFFDGSYADLRGTVRMLQLRSLIENNANAVLLDGAVEIEDSVFFFEERTASGNYIDCLRVQTDARRSLSRCVFAIENGTAQAPKLFLATGGAAGSFELNRCVLWGGATQLNVVGGQSYLGDLNVWRPENGWHLDRTADADYGGVPIHSLAAWQAATGQDARSVYLTHADQRAGGAHAFWLAHAEAAAGTDLNTIGPAAGDFRINPGARVFGGDGVPHIGTFADGTTPITEAGPQTHWDWNRRDAVGGAPTAWPNVPRTAAEDATYVAAPEAWLF